MASEVTDAEREAIASFIKDRSIPVGVGNGSDANVFSSIVSAEHTDPYLDGMSLVMGTWIVPIHKAMPLALCKSDAWRWLVPLAARTGCEPEQERQRLALLMDWMWGTVLPTLQQLADTPKKLGNKRGFGSEWRAMTTERTSAAAVAAHVAATEATFAALHWAEEEAAAAAAAAAKEAARAADATARAEAVRAAEAVARTARPATNAADAAAAWAAGAPVPATHSPPGQAAAARWVALDPPLLLARLVSVT